MQSFSICKNITDTGHPVTLLKLTHPTRLDRKGESSRERATESHRRTMNAAERHETRLAESVLSFVWTHKSLIWTCHPQTIQRGGGAGKEEKEKEKKKV